MRRFLEPSQLRLRAAVPTVAALVAVAAVGGLMLERLCGASTDSVGAASARAGADAYLELLDASSDELGATLGSLSLDEELTAAVASRDARRVLAVAGARFHDLRLHHGISHWSYWEPEPVGSGARALRNLVRLATPTLRGDVVERETLARAVRDQALVSGVELGYTGFGLRAVAPLRDGARVVGYAELGRNLELLVADMTRLTGDEFVVALDKSLIDPRRWSAARAVRGELNNWDDHRELVLTGNPAHAGGVTRAVLGPDLPAGGVSLGPWVEGQRTFARGAFPLRDAAGRRVGAVVAFRDVTDLARRSAALRRRAMVELAGAVVLSVLALGIAFELLVVRAGRVPGAPRPRTPGPPPRAGH
jgi:hypothetical protein